MTTQETFKPIADISIDDVVKTYSGKPGCGCGCKGTYRVNPKFIAYANKERGFEYDAEDVNLSTCKRRLTELKKADPEAIKMNRCFDDEVCYALETETRYVWIYVKETV